MPESSGMAEMEALKAEEEEWRQAEELAAKLEPDGGKVAADAAAAAAAKKQQLDAHRLTCLPYQIERADRAEAELTVCRAMMKRRSASMANLREHKENAQAQIEAVRMRAKRKLLHVRGQVVDSFLSTLLPQLMLLAVGSLLAQGLRRDGSFAVAIYTLLAGFSQKDYLIRFAIWLLIFSLCADFFWIIVQGPLAFVDEPPYVVLTDSTEPANVAGDKIVEAINGTLARSVTMEETLKVEELLRTWKVKEGQVVPTRTSRILERTYDGRNSSLLARRPRFFSEHGT